MHPSHPLLLLPHSGFIKVKGSSSKFKTIVTSTFGGIYHDLNEI